ncbi:MAG: TSUP family transporter, partial [Jannaschia sp.]
MVIPEGLGIALATPHLLWVLAAVLTAGIVYGFAGFGAALIFMPVGARLLPPEVAVGAFAVSAIGSAATMLPRVWPQVDKARTGWMILAATITLPLGLMVLT